MRREVSDHEHEPPVDRQAARVFEQLADLAHRQLRDEASAEVDRRGLLALRARLAAEPTAIAPGLFERLFGRGAWRFGLAGAGVAAVVAIVIAIGGASLSYTIEGGVIAEDGGLVQHEPRAAAATLHFSDGTDVRVERTGRARVAAVTRRGARVVLQEGAARVRVAKRPKARWMFEAGPFEVQVTGTAFELKWSPKERRFDVALESGSVRVRGPLTGDGVNLRAGERMQVSLVDGRMEIAPLQPPKAVKAPRIEALPAAPATAETRPTPAEQPAPAEPRATARPTGGRAPEPPSWSRRVATGDHGAVVREAERRGVAVVLQQAGSADLSALADAARYSRRNGLARRALISQRDRFPGSPRAEDAAFLLGRLAEDVGRDLGEALRWYNTYLEESPAGAYATEALGRKLLVLHKLLGRDRACPTARLYLERQPNGPYAKIARDVCLEK